MIESGTTINSRYRVDRMIGEGGMAVVHAGHDVLLGRDVAIKSLHTRYATDPMFRARFRREAQAAAVFSHPNIVDIYDVGETRGIPYFVMEYVRGQTLKEIIDREGPFHPDDVAGLLQQLCSALDYAHERGFVHRDVKPGNVMVDGDGHVIVVDFGIAKGLDDADLTDIGAGLGTVNYISPEQASGRPATPASDVYSSGIVAYEMLTRHVPFGAESPVGLAMQHVQATPPPPSTWLPSIPPAVDAIVLRALDKDPNRRFPSAGAFARAMTYWRQYRPPALQTTDLNQPGPDGTPTRPVAFQQPGAADARQLPPPPPPAPASRNRELPRPAASGCARAAIGAVILAGLIGLIVLGIRFSRELPGRSAPAPGAAVATLTPEGPVAPAILATEPPAPPTVAPAISDPTTVPTLAAVPDLVGRTVDDAAAAVAEQGLTLTEGPPVNSPDIPPGAVVRQDPAPGDTLAPGSAVTVQVSAGPAPVDLRSLGLIGLPFDAASQLLKDQGIAPYREDTRSTDIPAGNVVATDPPDSARPGDAVRLQVSMGDKVQIPNGIQGQSLDEAVAELERLGLKVGNRFGVNRQTVESAGINLDSAGIQDLDVVGVQGRDVDFGAWVDPGSTVDVVYYDPEIDAAP